MPLEFHKPEIWVQPISDTEYAQRLTLGLARYRNENQDWAFNYFPKEGWAQPPPHVVGAILWCAERNEHQDLATQIPCVQLSNRTEHLHIPAVTVDDEEVGRRAAEHFLDRGFQSFFYVGPPTMLYSQERWRGFRDEIFKRNPDAFVSQALFTSQRSIVEDGELDALLQRMRRRPPPWALFCSDDWWAQFLLRVSRSYGLIVPGELSLLGVNNESHVCELSDTPLSSVDLPAEEIGYEAGRILDRMIHGDLPKSMHTKIPVKRIVTRNSTDIHAVPDPLVSKALSLLQARMAEPVHVEEIARDCGVSRRVLERRFKEVVNISPYRRLLQFRITHAKSLLRATPWSLQRIAAECGFAEQKYLSLRFKEQEGISPLRWRKAHMTQKPD